MSNDTYIIKSIDSFFVVKIRKYISGEEFDVRVSPVSGKKEGDVMISDSDCLTVHIEKSFSDNTASIDYIQYNERCSLFEPMKKGSGTQEMVKSVLSLCRKLFGVSRFTMSDTSKFMCVPQGNIEPGEVELGIHNLLVYGKSWYERKFDAVPSSINDRRRWEMSKVLLAEKVDRERADRLKRSVSINIKEEDREQFLDIIEGSIGTMPWNFMFEEINESYNGCSFFMGRNMDFITDTFSVHRVNNWYIPISDDDMETYLVAYDKIQ